MRILTGNKSLQAIAPAHKYVVRNLRQKSPNQKMNRQLILTRLPIVSTLAAALMATAIAQTMPNQPSPAGTGNNGRWYRNAINIENYQQIRAIYHENALLQVYDAYTNVGIAGYAHAQINGAQAYTAAEAHGRDGWEPY